MNSDKSVKLGTGLYITKYTTYGTVEFFHVFGVGDVWCIWRKCVFAL